MKNALASLLIISLCISLGMNYSLWQRWKTWAPEKTAWTNNEWAWCVREMHEANESTDQITGQLHIVRTNQAWIDKADAYLREEKHEQELRKRRADVAEKLREAGIE
ncbi:MAG: hypothetical protein EOP85_03580 [Verrucomicrobiaceae bacterium]|nr:MAG: hypothetical protein EOP85_03580 [Verrucomicrobiaceae bacterium]